MSGTVIVVGDALLDVTARPAAAIRPGADVPAEVRIGCGGQGANLAVRLARRGIDVELICGLADDRAAALVAEVLRAERVRVNRVRVESTGAVVILLDDTGERTMLSQRAPFVSGTRISSAAWTVVSGYCLLETDAGRFARMLADRAAHLVVVGCAVPEASRAAWRAAVAAAGPDLLILNREEASDLAPVDELSAGTVVTSTDVIAASIGGQAARVSVASGQAAVDTTGAGDAFAAALVAGLVRAPWPPSSATLESAMVDAAVLAGQVARARGAQVRVAAEVRA
ncbi:MAG: carbohydrate kinase family protein [Candidatus Limnocylindria bacterium]